MAILTLEDQNNLFIVHSPGIGQVEGNRQKQHKCKYCGVFVVQYVT